MTSHSKLLVTGFNRSIKVGDVVKVYKEVLGVPTPIQGRIQCLYGKNHYSITIQSKTIDTTNLESIKISSVYSLETKGCEENDGCISFVRCLSNTPREITELASDTSRNGKYFACLKSRDSSITKGQILEIWDKVKLLKRIDISDLDLHGTINTDAIFCRLVWSPFGNQDKLLYICQPKRPKPLSYFKELPSEVKTSLNNGSTNECDHASKPTDSNRGDDYIKREHWGEQSGASDHTIVAVLDVADDCSIKTIDVEGFSLAYSQWIDNGSKIVSVAYQERPRRLGLVYCNNRASKILVHDWKSSGLVLDLGSATECVHSPRVNNGGTKFFYLTNPVHGAHQHAVKAHLYDFITRTSIALVDESTKKAEMFIENLPDNCFTSDDKHVLFVGADHLYHHMFIFSLETMRLSKTKFPATAATILDFHHDIILAAGSDINSTPTLYASKLCLSNINELLSGIRWCRIGDCLYYNEIEYEAFKIPTADQKSFSSAILVKPNPAHILFQQLKIQDDKSEAIAKRLPTVVVLHGGPHAAFNLCYIPTHVLYARLGLKCLMINYRGSTGVDEEYLRCVQGLVGKQDVDDCLHVIRHCVKEGLVDSERLVITGGSHGGFLACHLSCQDEFKFTSAIIRNPVTDISTMHSATDIPDWCYNQSLNDQSYDASYVPTSEDLIKMFQCSPYAKANKANVPTLMLLGNQDLRCPMFQGERWIDNLRARGVETLCKVYPDGHALAKPEVAADVFITAVEWILDHLPKH